MSTVIEITAIRPPKENKKVATVVAATGQSYQCFPDKLAKWGLREGERYSIDIEEREFNSRTYRTIIKATPAQAARNGAATHAPRMAAPLDAEQAFVARTLAAFIAAGKVGLDARELGEATRLLQRLHSHFFGADNSTFTASEAGQGGAHAH
jgi:hypothetical protein